MLAQPWRRAERRTGGYDRGATARRTVHIAALEWAGDRLVNIRDFRFARYVTEGAELFVME